MFKIVNVSKMRQDVLWSFISIIISALCHLLLRSILGKELGASGLGLYTLVFMIYMLGIQFSGFGLGVALTKYVAEHNNNLRIIKEFVSSGVIISFIIGSMMGGFLYIFSDIIAIYFFHNSDMVYLLKITSFSFPFIALQKAVLGTLNGLRKMKYFAYLNVVQNIVIFIVSVIFVMLFKMDVTGAIFGLIFPTIIISILSLVFIKDLFEIPSSFLNSILKELSFFGFYVVLINSISTINSQVSTLLIGYYMNEVEVGYYAVALIFVQGIILIPSAVQYVTSPAIATYHGKKEYMNIKKLTTNVMLKTFLIAIISSFVLIISGSFLITTIFTEEFLPAYLPLIILLIGNSIFAPIVSIGGALSSIGKVNIVFGISVLSTFINLFFNILLIPKFGIIGAALATSSSLLITAVIQIFFIKKYIFQNYF